MFQSAGKKLLGEGSREGSVNLLGKALMGVSPGPDVGCGRPKGLAGPVCPALRSAETFGEGGGRITVSRLSAGLLGPVVVLGLADSVASSPPDCSEGIVTVKRGRSLLIPGGGSGPGPLTRSPIIGATGGPDCVLIGTAGFGDSFLRLEGFFGSVDLFARATAPTSILLLRASECVKFQC